MNSTLEKLESFINLFIEEYEHNPTELHLIESDFKEFQKEHLLKSIFTENKQKVYWRKGGYPDLKIFTATTECSFLCSCDGQEILNLNFLKNNQFIKKNNINHPNHYGGENNVYEVIKIIEAHKLNFNLGNVLKYVLRAGKKDNIIQDLEKADWYLQREINNLKNKKDE